MQLLLYDRDHGFYTRHLRIGTGPRDHFSTRPVEHSPRYGQTFAQRLVRLIGLAGLDTEPFNLVALGDGTGVFFRDILDELKNSPGIYARLRKTSLELVTRFTEEQKQRLAQHDVRVINGSAVDVDRHVKAGPGVVFANELIDQFPVHKVVQRGDIVREKYLTLRGENLIEVDGPLSSPDLAEYLRLTGQPLYSSRPTAIAVDAMKLLRNISRVLDRGLILIVDYNTVDPGISRIAHPRFGRRNSLVPKTVWQAIGQDVTTDVDFQSLKLLARHFGFEALFEATDEVFLSVGYEPKLFKHLGFPMKVLVLGKL